MTPAQIRQVIASRRARGASIAAWQAKLQQAIIAELKREARAKTKAEKTKQ